MEIVDYIVARPGEVKVIFPNTGGELSQQDLPFLFERSYRGEKSRAREDGGRGIGPTIAKGLIEANSSCFGAEISRDEIRIRFTLPS
jgi:two-component system sensor histidine kinase BaeS